MTTRDALAHSCARKLSVAAYLRGRPRRLQQQSATYSCNIRQLCRFKASYETVPRRSCDNILNVELRLNDSPVLRCVTSQTACVRLVILSNRGPVYYFLLAEENCDAHARVTMQPQIAACKTIFDVVGPATERRAATEVAARRVSGPRGPCRPSRCRCWYSTHSCWQKYSALSSGGNCWRATAPD